jgi:hypothetical protein
MRRTRNPAFVNRKASCWLARFDPLHNECDNSRPWEAFHFVSKVEIRNCATLAQIDPELLELAQWDVRNAGPACVNHHRRFDSLADAGPGSAITVPYETLPADVLEFIADWGLECEAERKFPLRPLSPL